MQNRALVSITVLFLIFCLYGCSSSTTDDDPVDVTPPPEPVGLSFQNNQIANGSASLIWNAVNASDLAGYNVYWLGESIIDTTTANKLFCSTTSVMVTGLDYETRYYFGVTAIDKSGNESGLSATINGRPLNTTPPLSPSGLDIVAENIDFPKITVFWESNNEPDLGHYNVYRATRISDLDDSTSFLTSVTKESFIDVDIAIDSTYYYSVTAVDKAGWESEPSSAVSDFALSQVTLVTPVNFEYVSKKPTLTWVPVEGAVSYNIIVTTSRIGGEIWNYVTGASTSSVVYGGKALISGNTYYWKVGAISNTEINSVSDVGSFVVSTP